jgi:hypothetical protein
MLLKVVGWLLGLVSVIFVAYYFDNGHIFSGVICVFAVGLFIPPILNKINANAKKTAEEKGKKHQDLTLKSSIIGGVVLFFIALFIAAPSHSNIDNANVVMAVSDFDYTMNNKQAVRISYGQSQTNYCDVTIYRDSVISGYSVDSKQRSTQDFSMSCNWDGVNYVQSSKHPTSSSFKIGSIDTNTGSVQLDISLHLVDPSTDKYFTLKEITLNLNKQQLNNLLKKI